jgi:hypothetical protein
MKLSEYKKHYYEFSGKASDVSRQLAFAGIAVVWIFRLNTTTPQIPKELILPLALLISFLFFDLLQYLCATFIWGYFQWSQERNLQEGIESPDMIKIDETELDAPGWYKIPQLVLFILKIISIFLGYIFLGFFVWKCWVNR